MTTCLLPENPGGFGNKFKCYLSCLASGIPTRANLLEGFQEFLDPRAFDVSGFRIGHKVCTWRCLVPKSLERCVRDKIYDLSSPDVYDTTYDRFQQCYGKDREIDLKYNKTPEMLQVYYRLALGMIPWLPDSLYKITNSPFGGKKIIGVSVRSWKAPHELQNPLAQHRAFFFSSHKYRRLIELQEGYDGIYFSYDNPDLVNDPEFKNLKFPIVTLDCVKPFDKAVALSHCELLIGDSLSTFLECAWWIGDCKARVLLV